MKEEPWEPVRSKVHSIVRLNVSGQRFFGALFCVVLCCFVLHPSVCEQYFGIVYSHELSYKVPKAAFYILGKELSNNIQVKSISCLP